jgi:hypothetical protein
MTASRKPNGRSSIYQGRDGKWHGWVTMGVKTNGSADRRHRTADTQASVTAKVRKLETERDAGKTSKPGKVPTVAQWMRTYINDIAPLRVTQGTIDKTYRPKTERWIIPKLGRHRLDRLTPEHLYKFYKSLRQDDGLAANTIVQIHRILSRALKIAVRQEIIGRNPCTMMDAPQPEEPEHENLTGAEARAFLKTTAKRRNGTRWSIALALGLRQSEALGLWWKYVDLDKGVIYVHWQITHARYKHGCKDAHACGEQWHRYPCPTDCPMSMRTSGRKHTCETPCPPNCAEHNGQCPKFCQPDCTRHAKACPKRIGGINFHAPRASERAPFRYPRRSSPHCTRTSKHSEPSATPLVTPGKTGIWFGTSRTDTRSTRTSIGRNGRKSSAKPKSRTCGCTTLATPPEPCSASCT